MALEAAVLPDQNNYVTLVLENLGAEPIILEEGQILGHMDVQFCTDHKASKEQSHTSSDSTLSAGMCAISLDSYSMEGDGDPACTEDRPQSLRSVLKVDESNLTPKQRKELQEELATEFADVFTFDSHELTSTNLVQYAIHTHQ